jgi:hypothetical protein
LVTGRTTLRSVMMLALLVVSALVASVGVAVGDGVGVGVADSTVQAVHDSGRATLASPAQRVVVVSDSVGLGAASALPAAFPPGWDVNVIGTPAHFVEMLESVHVRPQLAANPQMFGDHVVIAGGYNYPYWDPARFDRSIDSMIATLTANGVENVYWVTLREVKPQFVSASAWNQVQPYYWYFPTVNEHLRRAVERHPALTLVDWAAAADRPGLTYDAIHLNTFGAGVYSELVAGVVQDTARRSPNGGVTRIPVGPAGAGAVAINITSTGSRAGGYVAAYPCDTARADVSNLNHVRGQTVAAAAIVPVSSSGEICVYNHQAGHVIVDLFGRFTSDGAATTTGAPARLVDTRTTGRQPAGTTRRVQVTAPTGAAGRADAVALNATAVEAIADGFVSVHPCSITSPDTSNVNFVAGDTVPNLVVAAPDGAGDICVTTSATTHVLVDRFTSFATDVAAPPESAPLSLITPRRVVDTRRGGTRPAVGEVVRFTIGEAGLEPSDIGSDGRGGIFANVTIADPGDTGYATVYPCNEARPDTSNVNYVAGRNVANMVTVRPDSSGAVCVYASTPVDVIVDVLGATGDGFVGIVPERVVDTRR